MAQKDLTSKVLESEPDVFADIFNTLLFHSDETKITDAENSLTEEPTEGFYRDTEGNVRNVFQDIAKGYRKGDSESYLACFNIENESMIKRTVPLKCFGYKYATLKRQQELYDNKRRALLDLRRKANEEGNWDKIKMVEDELTDLGKFHTIPFISIVLNFDDKRWSEPTNLAELNIDSVYNQYDQPFNIKVFDVKFFTEEERARFTSDFRIFLEMFCTNALPKVLEDVSLKHPTELIDMVIAFTNNHNLKTIRNKIAINELEGKVISMGSIFDEIANSAKYETVINTAKRDYNRGKYSQNEIIQDIAIALAVDEVKALEIFEKEVLMLETV